MSHRSAAPSLPPESPIAGRFRIVRTLGKGGQATVYEVNDIPSGRSLALKRLNPTKNPRVVALFEREYHTLAGLRHPSIVEVYEYGQDASGTFYYTMELVEGEELSRMPVPMPWRSVCGILRDVASSLGILHARGLVHRDLTPRNLLVRQDGSVKLIDFGALTPVGPIGEIVGTAPFVAPESLHGQIDQCADLFTLGALAYWLLTGVHAFPARNVAELPALWVRDPASPSSLTQLVDLPHGEPCPPQLDALVDALLQRAPAQRLSSTAELIDRLTVLADLPPESHAVAARGYLESKAFVGRERERARALALLHAARGGKGAALIIEGADGVGRSRFLQELAVLARLDGAITATTRASPNGRPYGGALALLAQLAAQLPAASEAALGFQGEALSRLSDPLAAAAAPEAFSREERVRSQSALRAYFLALAEARPIALLVDDLHLLDEPSRALIGALAHAMDDAKLLLVATLASSAEASAPSLASFRNVAVRLTLKPLSKEETLELLHSVFGQTPYLERLAERLHRASEGNPAYCLELAEHLVRTGLARYEEGTWALPSQLSSEQLPPGRGAAHLARIAGLSPATRRLAQLLSVPHHGSLTMAHCRAAVGLSDDETQRLLDELVLSSVLRRVDFGYGFVHPDVRSALCAELASADRKAVHQRLARSVLESEPDGHQTQLRACVHALHAGNLRSAITLLRKVALYFLQGDMSSLQVTAPLLEEVHTLLKERDAPEHVRVGPLTLLAIAGYFVDRRFAVRYGDEAVRILRGLMQLGLAVRLRRLLGRHLALFVALLFAQLGLWFRRFRLFSVGQLGIQLCGACSALSGCAAISLDPKSALGFAAILEPLTALGRNHAASIVHRFNVEIAHRVEDRLGATIESMSRLLERLESKVPIRALDDGVKINFIAGCHLALGICECWRDGDEALARADRLAEFGPLYAMGADQLRASYYAGQGDTAQSAFFQKRMELHAVELGSTWQVETWTPLNRMTMALRINDALMVKRAAQELERQVEQFPTLLHRSRFARGAYLIMRGQYDRALALLDAELPPQAVIGWTHSRGLLARALNGLGQHARARAVCQEAIGLLTDTDLDFVMMNLGIRIELAHAEAGLGHFDVARAQVAAMLARHGPDRNPITLGSLHEAALRIALTERDLQAAQQQLREMERCYRSTTATALSELVDQLRDELEQRLDEQRGGPREHARPRVRDDAAHLLTRLEVVLANDNALRRDRGATTLRLAMELSGADTGFLVSTRRGGVVEAEVGDRPDPALIAWARDRIARASRAAAETVVTALSSVNEDTDRQMVGRLEYRLVLLWHEDAGQPVLVAALVLGRAGHLTEPLEPGVLVTLGHYFAGDSRRLTS